MPAYRPDLAPLGDEDQVVRFQELDASCDAVDLGDEGEAAGGAISLTDALEEVLDLGLGVDDGILADVEIGGLGAVDLEDAEEALVAVAADEVESGAGLVEAELLQRAGARIEVLIGLRRRGGGGGLLGLGIGLRDL